MHDFALRCKIVLGLHFAFLDRFDGSLDIRLLLVEVGDLLPDSLLSRDRLIDADRLFLVFKHLFYGILLKTVTSAIINPLDVLLAFFEPVNN